MEIDWAALRASAIEVMRRAYVPASDFPVGVAALVDDGRVIVGCNVASWWRCPASTRPARR
jgi:cytidine deaminase